MPIRTGRDRRGAPSQSPEEQRRREWLESYRAHARELGGECLSPEYRSAHEKLRWRCAEGHEWEAEANSVRQGRWCPICAKVARPAGKKARNFVRVRAIAEARGGACLSTEYVDSQTHLRWRCAEGHEWEAVPNSIAAGTWCPRCAGRAPLTIDDMHSYAGERGGRCLSQRYLDRDHPLRWRCAEGHEWTAPAARVLYGAWCTRCSGRAPKTLADIRAMATAHGGTCLSRVITSSLDVLRFRCRVGHVFESNANRVQQGHWCPRCRSHMRGTWERLARAAERRGGELLTREYEDSQTAVLVRCAEGHEWRATPVNLIGGRWCRECWIASRRGRPSKRLGIADMQEAAESRGGRCLSEFYVNIGTKLRWQCHDGHEWEATPAGVRTGHWCPICANRHRGTIDAMRALAAERGGECRSPSYQNHNDLLRFTCASGHEFTATGMAVKSGVWCPLCGESDPVTPPRARPRANRPPPR